LVMRGRNASATSLAIIAVIVVALVLGVYFILGQSGTGTTTAGPSTTNQQVPTSTPASSVTTVETTTSMISGVTDSMTTGQETGPGISSSSSSFVTSDLSSSLQQTSVSSLSSSTTPVSSISITTVTYTTVSTIGTGTSIPGWEFLVRIVISGTDATVSSNLTYTGSTEATFALGDPFAVTMVENSSGDVIWSTVSTALLRLVNVTYGQSFIFTQNVSAGVLQSGGSYTFITRPQLNAQSGVFLGDELQLSFNVTVPGSTEETSCTYTITEEPTTYTTVSGQTITQSYPEQTVTTTTVC